MRTGDIKTPALIADLKILEANISTMASKRPGKSLRPHVKAFKSTELAKKLVKAGHDTFCCATIRELEGMAEAGICLLYTSPSPRDRTRSRMPSSA